MCFNLFPLLVEPFDNIGAERNNSNPIELFRRNVSMHGILLTNQLKYDDNEGA